MILICCERREQNHGGEKNEILPTTKDARRTTPHCYSKFASDEKDVWIFKVDAVASSNVLSRDAYEFRLPYAAQKANVQTYKPKQCSKKHPTDNSTAQYV